MLLSVTQRRGGKTQAISRLRGASLCDFQHLPALRVQTDLLQTFLRCLEAFEALQSAFNQQKLITHMAEKWSR